MTIALALLPRSHLPPPAPTCPCAASFPEVILSLGDETATIAVGVGDAGGAAGTAGGSLAAELAGGGGGGCGWPTRTAEDEEGGVPVDVMQVHTRRAPRHAAVLSLHPCCRCVPLRCWLALPLPLGWGPGRF
jgi:hypothetical protein